MATSNLAPYIPAEWDSPIVAASSRGARRSTELAVDRETYVSWAIGNKGPFTLNRPFFVDLYFDYIPVGRWPSEGMSVNYFSYLPDWDELNDRVRLTPGKHTLRLVVDSTNLINETDESDNVYQREFTWSPGGPTPTPLPSKLPDLVPFTPEGWSGPLVATSYAGDVTDGPLSVTTPTYIRYSVRNQGLATTPEDVWVHLYLDDMLVDLRQVSGVLAEDHVEWLQWDKLLEVIPMAPGNHTLKMVVDPAGLVTESNEDNNTLEKQVTWSTGPVPPRPTATPTPTPAAPPPPAQPNLVPGWRFGWDGPIVVSHEKGSQLDGPLTIERTPFVDVVVLNRSPVGVEQGFTVDLYFDGTRVESFEAPEGLGPGELATWPDWEDLAERASLTPGPHTLKLVIDPEQAIAEASEDDNTYEKTFTWAAGQVASPTPIVYSEEALRQKLEDIESLLDIREPAVGPQGPVYAQKVLDIADAGYYLLTGKSIRDERATILLLSHQDYLAWIDAKTDEELAVSQPSEYDAIVARREAIKSNTLGFTTHRFGKVAVIVDAQRGVADVISTLAHELGHMRQRFLNPEQSDGVVSSSHALNGIQEAQAQQFERAFWLKLEEFTGLDLLAFPDYEIFQVLIDERFNRWQQDYTREEHSFGYLLQWLVVLSDPKLEDLKAELLDRGQLGVESSLRLYNYLVEYPPSAADSYVRDRLQSLGVYLERMRELARGRLVPGLHPDKEGLPDLRIPALLMP